MVDSRLGQWFVLLSCVLFLVRTEGLFAPITYVTNDVAKGAVCLDGSPPAYHWDKGFGTGANSWLVHFEGGGWCNNLTTCLSRKDTRLGSSKHMAKNLAFSGIMNNRRQYNPDFYNWNRVKIRYCDGSSFTGDVQAVNPVTNLHFRGQRIWLAVMQELLAKGMKNAENALLSGCSAGGLASILHCDSFRALLPMGTKVKCLSDGGYFINTKDVSGIQHIQGYFQQVVSLHGSAKNLPQSCTSRMKPELCFFPQNVVQQIRTPLFILNAAYDSWQIKNILAPGDADPRGSWNSCKLDISNCSPVQLKTMQDFRAQFLNALYKSANSSSRGLYIDSCFAHCQTETQETWFMPDSPVLSKTKIAKAVGDWFYDRTPFQKIDCPYPCNPTCHNTVYAANQPPENPKRNGSTGLMQKTLTKCLLCWVLLLMIQHSSCGSLFGFERESQINQQGYTGNWFFLNQSEDGKTDSFRATEQGIVERGKRRQLYANEKERLDIVAGLEIKKLRFLFRTPFLQLCEYYLLSCHDFVLCVFRIPIYQFPFTYLVYKTKL